MVIYCCGLDLAARERKPSGLTILKIDNSVELIEIRELYGDSNILAELSKYDRLIVAIDSPLSLPVNNMSYRQVDLELRKMGYRVLPPTWRYMKELTIRAMELTKVLNNRGIVVFETHPRSSLKSSHCNTFEELVNAVDLSVPRDLSIHEVDSVIAAITCVFHVRGRSIVISSVDGSIVLLPKICR